MIIYILGFLVIGYFSFHSINFLLVYFKLKKQNIIVNAKVISKGVPKGSGWRLSIPKVTYEFNNQSYTEFVQHTMFSDYITEVGSEVEVYISIENPENCILRRPYVLILEFLFYLFLIFVLTLV